MNTSLQGLLEIPTSRLEDINRVLLDPQMEVIQEFLGVVAKYGTPAEINAKAEAASRPEVLRERIQQRRPKYLGDLDWLIEKREQNAFISVADYRRKILGDAAAGKNFKEPFAVTLEISACQYFPWVIEIAKRSIAEKKLMPGRFIRVRKMKEQEEDGDLPAMAAAMQIIGASWVETLDTKGTDGSNIHLGGPELDEFLYYYTEYGVRQVLNVNPGTVLLGYLLHRLGVDIEFKISVFMGNDNPYAALWTLIGAKLFSREDGTSPLIGFNWSNSINNRTMERAL